MKNSIGGQLVFSGLSALRASFMMEGDEDDKEEQTTEPLSKRDLTQAAIVKGVPCPPLPSTVQLSARWCTGYLEKLGGTIYKYYYIRINYYIMFVALSVFIIYIYVCVCVCGTHSLWCVFGTQEL